MNTGLEIKTDLLKKIKKRVNISKCKDNDLYSIYGEYYNLYDVIEEGKYIKYLFKHGFKRATFIEVWCQRFINVVIYDSFRDMKYSLTDEERRLYEVEYQKMYYSRNRGALQLEERIATCVICGKQFNPVGRQITCSKECQTERKKQKGKEYVANHKEHLRQKAKEWIANHPDRVKIMYKKYKASLKGQTTTKRYLTSEKGKAATKRYQTSEKGKIAIKKSIENMKKKLDK